MRGAIPPLLHTFLWRHDLLSTAITFSFYPYLYQTIHINTVRVECWVLRWYIYLPLAFKGFISRNFVTTFIWLDSSKNTFKDDCGVCLWSEYLFTS